MSAVISKKESMVMHRAQKTNQKLEKIRAESRQARQTLIDTIMCDEKDVLADCEIKAIQAAFARFLEVQERLGQAWFENANADAKMLWEVGKNMDPDIEPD